MSLESVYSPPADAFSNVSLPLVDFASWQPNSTPEQRREIGKQLADACHSVGFVYIINHSISSDLLAEAFRWSKRLFDLPVEAKMLAPHPDGPAVHRGYSYPGLEKVSQIIGTDEEVGEQLREVQDCKVRPFLV
jgi:isopenicillin N synthase-like dioxygenase